MKSIKIKETYLLFLIVMGLISLATYSTYALFTASTEILDVVGIEATLTTDSNILEYEMVTVPAGESKVIELTINNSYGSSLYYGVWYEVISPQDTSGLSIGLYTSKDSTASSGQVASGASTTLLVGINNLGYSQAIVNVGTVGSLTASLGITSPRTLLTSGWTDGILVTDDYLEQHIVAGTSVSYKYNTATTTSNISSRTKTLAPGVYKLEAWGAQGGTYGATNYGNGGLGGYSYGTLTLYESTTVYMVVGGKGSYTTNSGSAYYPTGASNSTGGANGGGKSSYYGGGGGGASDIRIGTNSLYARVIVAGGGGGAQGASGKAAAGGFGGGIHGGNGDKYSGFSKAIGGGGLQTKGGEAGYHASYPADPGTFGTGGNSGRYTTTSNRGCGAGGGGWYGGGGAANSWASGGGGSGFVYTKETAHLTDSSYTGGTWLLDSRYYLKDAGTIGDGVTTFLDYDGTTSVVGHSGAGAVKITGTTLAYSIPTITGLTDLSVTSGASTSLTSGVAAVCESGQTGCSLVGPTIANTSTLSKGVHTVYYTVKATDGTAYIYPRTVTVS